MKIAIVGGGLAGLSSAYYLTRIPGIEVDLYTVPGGASAVSTGLVHPFPGKFAKRSWRAGEALQKTRELLLSVEGVSLVTVANRAGILKPAVLPYQLAVYPHVARRYVENEWLDTGASFHPAFDVPSLYLPEGMTIFSQLYLQGLTLLAKKQGVRFFEERIDSLSSLEKYDQILLTLGADLVQFQQTASLPVELVHGKAFLVELPTGVEPLPMSVMSQGHLSISQTPGLYYLGATYEREQMSDEAAMCYLYDRVGLFFPRVKECKIVLPVSGTRVCRVGSYVPILKRLSHKLWVYTGLGSRGLLYHAYLGELLASAIHAQDETLLPKETRV